ncbi:MAG: hypothetical protein WBW48_00710 [Anaerolineae bacterium]
MIRRVSILIVAGVLALATGIGVAASRDERAPAPGSPTPTEEISIPVPMKTTPTPSPTVTVNVMPCPVSADVKALEEFRSELLLLVDTLDTMYPAAQAYAEAKGEGPAPKVNRELIEEATHEQLCWALAAVGERYKVFKEGIGVLKATGLSTAETSRTLNSFSIIPTPTPVTTPLPGIRHADHDQTNATLGDLPPADYPSAPEHNLPCPKERYPIGATFAVLLTSFLTKEIDHFAEAAECEGTFFVVALPFGGGTNLPGCLGWGILKGISLATEIVFAGLKFCEGNIDYAEIAASEAYVKILHAELHMHDRSLTERFNTTDKFLFDFRNLNLRTRIEDNLASADDDPVLLFTLPSDVCITTDLEVISADNPKFSSGRIAGCGLLEVVSDTVRSAIDMTIIAGGSVNNAEAEFQAAVDHYNNGEWKLAYARFRKAYREAVRP